MIFVRLLLSFTLIYLPFSCASFSPDLPSMQYIEKNPLKYKLQEEHKSYGQIYVSRLHAFPATSERMPKKKSLNEAMVGWLSLCPLTLHLPLGRLKVAKKSKYSQNFVNLMCLSINWMKSYDIILLKINFLKVKMHHFRGNLLK